MADEFDVVVIGGGPGGYVCAIRAAQLGLKTACIEMRGTLGGTCLNVGCIPSKALLNSSEKFHEAKESLKTHGVDVGGVKLNLKQMMKNKTSIVDDLTKGIEFLFKKNKVAYYIGRGEITSPGAITVHGKKTENIKAKNIIIATGSDVASLPGIEIDEDRVVSSTGALSLSTVPRNLVVIGGGVIGLEMGSVWSRLGAKVTVVEYMDKIVPTMDAEVGKEFLKTLTKQGFDFKLSTKVTSVEASKTGVTLTVEPAKGGDGETLKADVVLVAVGRKPYTDGLGLDNTDVKLDDRGRIAVDAHLQAAPGIYAIGDVIQGPMLAHKAEEEGVFVAELIAGQKPHVNYDVIPSVVYTHPEIASVGKTEEELKAAGVKYNSGKFPFMANSRARANGDTDGFVKILADATTDRVLGVHIIGPAAGTLIAEAAIAMEFGASSEDIARTCHAHPTLNEAVKEAALGVDKRAVHV